MAAADGGQVETIVMLIYNGANVNLKDGMERKAVDYAVERSNLKSANILREANIIG